MSPRPGFITAVIVLYERTPLDSEAFLSLQAILLAQPEFKACFRIILYDNSPVAWTPVDLSGLQPEYVHDATNRGLATAYNHALKKAVLHDSEWLLLLDQDTTLTQEYVSELVVKTQECSTLPQVCAVVPLLELQGRIYSPEADFFYHVRHQFPHTRYYPVSRETSGIQHRSLSAYNSGAAIRVSALEQLNGFPVDFRIDFLDHAVFRELHQQGFSLYVLKTVLQQKLAHIDLNAVSLQRHTSVLQSQTLFVARYGNKMDRLLFRLWLLRKSREYRELCHDPRVWRGMARQALGKWRLLHQENVV